VIDFVEKTCQRLIGGKTPEGLGHWVSFIWFTIVWGDDLSHVGVCHKELFYSEAR